MIYVFHMNYLKHANGILAQLFRYLLFYMIQDIINMIVLKYVWCYKPTIIDPFTLIKHKLIKAIISCSK